MLRYGIKLDVHEEMIELKNMNYTHNGMPMSHKKKKKIYILE